MVEIASIATALPPHSVEAGETKRYLESYLGADTAARYSQIVDASRIRSRYTVLPTAELLRLRTLQDRNDVYVPHARALGEIAARAAVEGAGTSAEFIATVLSVSCTGYMMPSLDAHLVNQLGLPSNTRRIPITELGCSAGVAAVGLATTLLGAPAAGDVLAVSVEVSSPGVQVAEPSTRDMLANLLFGDGAAAVLLTARVSGRGPEVVASRSVLWADSLDHLGMRLTDSGFRLQLSPRLPHLVRANLRPSLDEFLGAHGLTRNEIAFWVVHPGGPKVIDAVAEAAGLSDRELRPTWETWERHGNLSSSTVFFILQRMQQTAPPALNDLGVMLGFGPGVTCEMVLLRAGGWLTEAGRSGAHNVRSSVS